MIKYPPCLAAFLVSLFCSQFVISETEAVQQVSGDKLVFEKVNGYEIATFNGKPYTGIRVDRMSVELSPSTTTSSNQPIFKLGQPTHLSLCL